MKLLSRVPFQLQGRHSSAIPVECDCGELFLWERGKGTIVICPTCKRMEALPDVVNWLAAPADQPQGN